VQNTSHEDALLAKVKIMQSSCLLLKQGVEQNCTLSAILQNAYNCRLFAIIAVFTGFYSVKLKNLSGKGPKSDF